MQAQAVTDAALMALKDKCRSHSPGTLGFPCAISNVWISTFSFKC